MTGAEELRRWLVRAAELGDQMSDALASLEGMPVVEAYLKDRRVEDSLALRGEWDELVGELQDSGVYQAELGAEANYYRGGWTVRP